MRVLVGAKGAVVGADEVEDELEVAAPVARVGEGEDSREGDCGEVDASLNGSERGGVLVLTKRVWRDENGINLDVLELFLDRMRKGPDGALPVEHVGRDVLRPTSTEISRVNLPSRHHTSL